MSDENKDDITSNNSEDSDQNPDDGSPNDPLEGEDRFESNMDDSEDTKELGDVVEGLKDTDLAKGRESAEDGNEETEGVSSGDDVSDELDPDLYVLDDQEEEEEEEELDPAERLQQRKEEFRENYKDFSWSEQIDKVRDKVENASDGDDQAYRDVSTAPQRAYQYFKAEKVVQDNIYDITLPVTLFVYGFVFLFLSFLLTGPQNTALFTEPNRIADLFLLDSVVLLLGVVAFALIQEYTEFDAESTIRRLRNGVRGSLLAVHLVATVVVGIIFYATVVGDVTLVSGLAESFEQLRIDIYQGGYLPEQVSAIGFWIWEVTPLGVTIQQISAGMFLLGILGSVPFALEIGKVVAISIVVGGEEITEDDDDESTEEDELGFDHSDIVENLENDRSKAEIMRDEFQSGKTKHEREDEEGMMPGYIADRLSAYGDPDNLLQSHNDYKMAPYNGYVEVDRYWLKEPYSYAVILENKEQGDIRYFAVEPRLSDEEEKIYKEFNKRISTAIRKEPIRSELDQEEQDELKKELLKEKVVEIATMYNMSEQLDDDSLQRILYFVKRDYVDYGKIDVLMNDPNVEDISCVGPNQPLWIYHAEYGNILTNIQFGERMLQSFIRTLARRSGETIATAEPIADATLPDGSRANLTLADEVTAGGSTFTIRQFQDIPFTPVDLINTGTFSVQQMAYLWLAIENDRSLIFAGGTASGKTTSMNAVSLFIPPKAKVVTIEDTREIELPHSNWIASKTRESMSGDGDDSIDMYELLEAALRQRPEYMVVGEIRGEEAQTLFQAMSTGHTTYSTMHADSVREAIYRLQNDPINVPSKMVQALDIICIQNRIHTVDENGDAKTIRRNESVAEITGADTKDDDKDHVINKAFTYNTENDSFTDYTNESQVLDDIRAQQAWTRQQLDEELDRRERLLRYLAESDIQDFTEVTRVIQQYSINPAGIMEAVENGNLEDIELEDVTEIDLESLENQSSSENTGRENLVLEEGS